MPFIKTNPLIIAGNVKPSEDYIWYDGPIPDVKFRKWDAETETIVEDSVRVQQELDDLSEVKQLDVILAMEALGLSADLDALLASGFQKYWNAAGGVVDLNHPITVQALQGANIDVRKVKQKIIEMTS